MVRGGSTYDILVHVKPVTSVQIVYMSGHLLKVIVGIHKLQILYPHLLMVFTHSIDR